MAMPRTCRSCPNRVSDSDASEGAMTCRKCRNARKRNRKQKGSQRKQFANTLVEGRRKKGAWKGQ